jgi:hypothetical protein
VDNERGGNAITAEMPRVGLPFAIRGYALVDLIGFGGTGEVWRARDETTGQPVAVKRLWEPAGPELVARLRTEATLLAEVAGRHAVALLDVRMLTNDEVVLVVEYAAGGSLASLLASRGRLQPSEVVTVLAPLARVLGNAHNRAMRHGDLTPSNILFAPDGCPKLSDFGLALAAGERPADDPSFRDPALSAGWLPGPASDVFGLAAIGYAALTGVPPRPADAMGRVPGIAELAPNVPPALASAVEAAMSPDPDDRPDAATFAAAILRSYPAMPVRLAGSRGTPVADPAVAARRTSRSRGVTRPLALLSVVAAVVVASAAAGIGRAHLDRPAATPLQTRSPAATPVAEDPTPSTSPGDHGSDYKAIVANLFALRAKAFATGDLSLLRSVYLHESLVLDMDRAALRVLITQHLRTRGFTQRIDSVSTEEVSDGFVQLWVTSTIPAYEIVGPRGRVVARRASRTQSFEMTIVRMHGRWLVQGLDKKSSLDALS